MLVASLLTVSSIELGVPCAAVVAGGFCTWVQTIAYSTQFG
jgi:hypothetical protein